MLVSRIVVAFLLYLLLAARLIQAEVRLPHMLSDHAVLQRNQPIHIWGWADIGESVSVSLHGQMLVTVADDLGKWSVYLKPEGPGGPYTLSVQGSNTIRLSDILIGDVWFASGQSNMEFPMLGFGSDTPLANGAAEIAAANQPQIRLLRFERHASIYEQADQDATWTLCTPDNAARFSAVAYFFGKQVQKHENVPIGLIDATWGGTPAAAWVGLDGLSKDSGLMPAFAARVSMVRNQADVPAILMAEQREDETARRSGQPSPKHAWHPDPDSYAPSMLFNGMVAPATLYNIKGVIWYQGETDSSVERAPLYERLFPALITNWRTRWHEGDFPFLFAQISSFTSTPEEQWGIIREAQRRTLRLANTGMAVTIDIGQANNVHPPDKQDVGARLALVARAKAYGESIQFSGPMFRQVAPDRNEIRIYFSDDTGLTAKGGGILHGFEVAGKDHIFHPAAARIDNGAVLATSPDVQRPEFVRYAWSNSSLDANLINGSGLPASTFTSEEVIPASR